MKHHDGVAAKHKTSRHLRCHVARLVQAKLLCLKRRWKLLVQVGRLVFRNKNLKFISGLAQQQPPPRASRGQDQSNRITLAHG